MANFKNNPEMKNEQGVEKQRHYSHQPLTFDHFGIHTTIKENGIVVISSAIITNAEGETEYDEVEVPASLIFKIANALKITRTITYVDNEKDNKT